MIPLLILAAGAAALEIKRLASRPQGHEEAQALLERERHLKQVLQVRVCRWMATTSILVMRPSPIGRSQAVGMHRAVSRIPMTVRVFP